LKLIKLQITESKFAQVATNLIYKKIDIKSGHLQNAWHWDGRNSVVVQARFSYIGGCPSNIARSAEILPVYGVYNANPNPDPMPQWSPRVCK